MRFHGRIAAIFAPIFGIGIMCASVASADGAHWVDHLPESKYTAQVAKGSDGLDHAFLKTPENGIYDLGALETLAAGTPIYHWGSKNEVSRLVAESQFSDSNMNYRMMHPVHGGAGFFFSLDRTDSASYGPRGVYYSLPRPARVVVMHSSDFMVGLLMMPYGDDSGDIATIEAALRTVGVDAIRLDNVDDWYVTFSPDLLVNPRGLRATDAP